MPELAVALPELVICAACGEENPGGHQTGCESCGSPLRILEPLVVGCGWCGASNHRDRTAHCTECGGPLPALAGGSPGARPPPVPRALPAGYERRVLWTHNVPVVVGFLFCTVFVWAVIFPLVGLPLFLYGRRRAQRMLSALVRGRATAGHLESIELDESEEMNGRNPWKITFSYDLHEGGSESASIQAWDPSHAERKPGDAVWVVYHSTPKGPNASIWPPLH